MNSRPDRENGSRTSAMLRLANGIDRVNGWIGRGGAWLGLLMILVGAYNAVVRYAGRFIGVNLSSNSYLELQWYLFSLVFLLGGAFALRERAHVRVDVFYSRLPARFRHWIDLAGAVLLLLPFCGFAVWATVPAVRSSWQVLETSPDPGGLPRYPLKTMILVGLALLALQGVAEIIKEIHAIRHGDGEPADSRQRLPEGL